MSYQMYLQYEPDEPFVRFGKPFNESPRQHAFKLWKKKFRPFEVRDHRNVTVATVYRDGALVIYQDLEHKEILQ